MKTIYEIFQFVGETELHIETLRQRLAKCPRFESYFFFKLIADSDTKKGVSHVDIYKFIQEFSKIELTDKFSAEDMLHLV